MPRKTHIPQGELPPLTRLKQLSAEQRALIATQLETISLENALAWLAKEFAIELCDISQLSRWRSWQRRQAPVDHYNAMAEQDEASLAQQFPNWTREQVREAAIKRMYAVADMTGDQKLTLNTIKVDLKDSQDRRDWEKVLDQKRTKVETALAAFAEKLEGHPKLLAAYEKFRAQVQEELKP